MIRVFRLKQVQSPSYFVCNHVAITVPLFYFLGSSTTYQSEDSSPLVSFSISDLCASNTHHDKSSSVINLDIQPPQLLSQAARPRLRHLPNRSTRDNTSMPLGHWIRLQSHRHRSTIRQRSRSRTSHRPVPSAPRGHFRHYQDSIPPPRQGQDLPALAAKCRENLPP